MLAATTHLSPRPARPARAARAARALRAKTLPLLLLVAALGALGGCGDDTAFDVVLVPDPNINDRAALLARIGGLELTLDNDGGLYPAATRTVSGDLRIEDIDGDGAGELVAAVDLPGDGRLPLVRLHRGGLPNVAVDLRVDGLGASNASERVAAGGVRALRFADGDVKRIEVPFNIRPAYRPPRVTQLVPAAGSRSPLSSVGSVFVIFSKRVEARALEDAKVVMLYRVDADGKASEVPAAERTVQFLPGDDSPTTLEYRLAEALDPGTYEMRVGSGARDTKGRALDQLPMEPGDQGFTARFHVGPENMTAPSTNPMPPHSTPLSCTAQKGCPPGTTCTGGRCVITTCPTTCGAGLVCHPTLNLCVDDCRKYGSHGGCTTKGTRCSDTSGVCVADAS